MAKETMLTYLDNQLTKKMADYEVALDWDVKNHTIELVVRLFAENSQQLALDDIEGVLSEEEIIEFEDGILLYHPEKSTFLIEDYLATLPYEHKKGMKQSDLDGLVDYLKEILDEGQSDLLDFLEDESEEAIFELHFSKEKWQEACQAYAEKGTNYLPYPSY